MCSMSSLWTLTSCKYRHRLTSCHVPSIPSLLCLQQCKFYYPTMCCHVMSCTVLPQHALLFAVLPCPLSSPSKMSHGGLPCRILYHPFLVTSAPVTLQSTHGVHHCLHSLRISPLHLPSLSLSLFCHHSLLLLISFARTHIHILRHDSVLSAIIGMSRLLVGECEN